MDPGKVGTEVDVLKHRGPRMGTILEVLRCEFARPGRADQAPGSDGIYPSKLWTPLHYAAYYNREAALLHFIRAGHPVDGDASAVETPLLVAVAVAHVNIVKILCAAGANIQASRPITGETALHLAIKSGRPDLLEVIFSHNPDLDAPTLHSHETPLHYAVAKSGQLATVLTLIKGGANNEALDSNGRSAAAIAISNSNIEAAVLIVNSTRGSRRKLVEEKEMLVRHVEKTQNRFAMSNDMIADIFEAGCDPGSTVLVEAIKRNDLAVAEMFLERGADPNRATATGLLPIFAALDCKGPQMVQLLVKNKVNGAVKDSRGKTALQIALERPLALDKDALKCLFDTLIAAGADPKVTYPDGKTLLHHVVSPPVQHPKIAQRLIVSGVSVDEVDDSGRSALHYAWQSRPCLEVLLKNNASATIADVDGLTPFFSAVLNASQEDEPDLEPLMKVSSLRLLGKDNKTALHIAAERGLIKTTRLLLRYRSETTLQDSKGRTPLLLAVLEHRWSVVPLLAMQPGINSWDEDGMTALHHVVTCIPRAPATWSSIASAAAKFCERGVSRTLRNRKGETPLISAVIALPEEGLPVIETLLADRRKERGSGPNNCVEHEDHKRRSALYHAVTQEKPAFVLALLKHGAYFPLEEATRAGMARNTPKSKEIRKLLAEHEWLQRMRILHRESQNASETAPLPSVLPAKDLEQILALGLEPNSLPAPRPNLRGSLLWVILNQSVSKLPLPSEYFLEVLQILFRYKADPNVLTLPNSISPIQIAEKQNLTRHPLTFLLLQHPDIDVKVITLLLNNGASMTTPSSFYKRQYPLHAAVKANRMEIVEEFLIRRADANVLDDMKRTPLYVAAEHGYPEIANLLLKYGAAVKIQDTEGNTPLHVAASEGRPTVVSNLLLAGAKALAKNSKGLIPSECVRDDLEEEDKSKVLKKLKAAQMHEERELEEEKRRAEERALREERERLRRAEEKARQEALDRQRKKEAEQALKREEAARQAALSKRKSASKDRFKLASRMASSSKPPAVPEKPAASTFATSLPNDTTTSLDVSMTNFLNDAIRSINRPTDSKLTATLTSPSREMVTVSQKLPNPRTDSGISNISTNKPLPELNRNSRTFGAEGSEELEGWLAVSNMLDRL
jgi:ankyrin repeat protein